MTAHRLPDAETRGPNALVRARPLLGTLVEIRAWGDTIDATAKAVDEAFSRVSHIHAVMSYHDCDSDVSRLNRAGMACTTVDPDTWQVLARARRMSEASAGAFDVSVAPALVRHGFLPRHCDVSQPAPGATWRDIALLPDHRVQMLRPLHLDLGGIAKGYAVDCAIDVLRAAGMHAARVNAGGDLRLFGARAETIHVRHPLVATRLMPLCALATGAVATSAPYYAGRQVAGQTVSPLIDAATGESSAGVRSVSVVADTCTAADALTKVVYTAPDRAIAALHACGAHAVILDADPDHPAGCRIRLSEPHGWRDAGPVELETVTA